jgi:hypothetical protein
MATMRIDDGDALGHELADLFLGLEDVNQATHLGLTTWLNGAANDLGTLLRRHNMSGAAVASEQARMRRSFWERVHQLPNELRR